MVGYSIFLRVHTKTDIITDSIKYCGTRCVLELSEHHVVVRWGVWTQYQVVILLIGGVKPLQGGRSAQPIKDHGLPLAPDNHHMEYIIPVKKSNTAFFHNGGKEPRRLRSAPTR